jgi:hypothetical protein
MRGGGSCSNSPENGLSRIPVLRVCRRRQAGNPDDSTRSHRTRLPAPAQRGPNTNGGEWSVTKRTLTCTRDVAVG